MVENVVVSIETEKKFLNTFLRLCDYSGVSPSPILITNISEKRQIASHFYCLVCDKHLLTLTKRFPGKKISYQLNLSDFSLETRGILDTGQIYLGFITSLRDILVDIKSRDARILRKG